MPRKPPPSQFTSGEMAASQALSKAGILFRSQVRVCPGRLSEKGEFKPLRERFWGYLVDFLVWPHTVIEIQGRLHERNFKSNTVASRRMEKDEVKRNLLRVTGFEVVEVTDKLVKQKPCEFVEAVWKAISTVKTDVQLEQIWRSLEK